jgi:tetratricopeptide (TPR) repeat protein
LANKQYQALWPDIERWAGPTLQRQWAIYLNEARERWFASKALETAHDYAQALASAGQYETLVREIGPFLERKLNPNDEEPIFIVSVVARALAQQGKWEEADGYFAKAQQIWPLESSANAINIAANRGRYLLLAGRNAEALKQMDAAIAQGRRWEVNPDALASMQHYRACILHELGRDAEARVSIALSLAVEFSVYRARLHLCMDNPEAARTTLVNSLRDPAARDAIILFVQKSDKPPFPSAYGRKTYSAADSIRSDPVLRAKVEEYGRVLPFSVKESAPN